MHELTLISLMSDNARPLYRALAEYLGVRLGLPVRLAEQSWLEQQRMLDAGAAELAFLCGLLYTQRADRLEPLAAPVPATPRYKDRPIYFSDVIVPRDSRFMSFEDLRGTRWAFNDPGSFSGYALLRAHLAELGENSGFCGALVESGGHTRSLALVAAGGADAAAIDSLVLDTERARDPELVARVRVVATLGPSPIPPAVVARHVPAGLRERLRAALLGLHAEPAGRAVLAIGQLARFAAVADHDYDDIRQKARRANQVVLTAP